MQGVLGVRQDGVLGYNTRQALKSLKKILLKLDRWQFFN